MMMCVGSQQEVWCLQKTPRAEVIFPVTRSKGSFSCLSILSNRSGFRVHRSRSRRLKLALSCRLQFTSDMSDVERKADSSAELGLNSPATQLFSGRQTGAQHPRSV